MFEHFIYLQHLVFNCKSSFQISISNREVTNEMNQSFDSKLASYFRYWITTPWTRQAMECWKQDRVGNGTEHVAISESKYIKTRQKCGPGSVAGPKKRSALPRREGQTERGILE